MICLPFLSPSQFHSSRKQSLEHSSPLGESLLHIPPLHPGVALGGRPAVGLQGEASCKDQNRRSKFKPRLEALGARGLWALGWLPSRGPFPWRGPPPCSLPTSRSGNCFVSGSENRFPPKEILSHRGEAGSGLEFPAVEKPGLRSSSARGHARRRTQTGTETETERPGNPPGTLRSRFWVLVLGSRRSLHLREGANDSLLKEPILSPRRC